MVPHQIHTDIRELSDSLVYNFALDQEDEFIFLMCCVYTYMIKYKRWDTNFTGDVYNILGTVWGCPRLVQSSITHRAPLHAIVPSFVSDSCLIASFNKSLSTRDWDSFFYHFHVFYKHSLTYSVEILICLYYKFHVDLLIDPVLKCFFR